VKHPIHTLSTNSDTSYRKNLFRHQSTAANGKVSNSHSKNHFKDMKTRQEKASLRRSRSRLVLSIGPFKETRSSLVSINHNLSKRNRRIMRKKCKECLVRN